MPPKRKKDASRDVDDGAPPAKQQRRNKKDVEAEPKADSDEKAPRDNIDWQANDWYNTWALLTCMERAENQKLIVGVRKGQKTAGENKKDAYNRMAEELFPNLYAKDKTGVSKRVKSQVEKLVKNYRLHAAKLRVTGGGIDAVEDDDDDFDDDKENDEPTSASDKHIMMKFYIGENGPTADTPLEGCNLWESITNEFRFFPRMHTMFSTRPNINPPAVVTGVGPAGASTTFYQPPPASLGLSAPAPTSTSAPSSPFCGLSLPSPALSRQNSSNLDNTNDLDPFVHQVMATQAGADNQNDMEMNDDEFSQFLRSLPGYDSDFSGDGLDMFHRTSMEWGTARDTSMYPTPDPTPRVASSFSFPFHEQPLPQTPTPRGIASGSRTPADTLYTPASTPAPNATPAPKVAPPVTAAKPKSTSKPMSAGEKKAAEAQKVLQKARTEVVTRPSRPHFETELVKTLRDGAEAQQSMEMKRLRLEVMAAYATRRDGVMKRHQAGMLTKEEANAKIDEIDDAERQELAG